MSPEPSREYSARLCAWCRGPIRPGSRSDTITCSTRCRQARARFAAGVGAPPPAAGGPPLRLAYADPPYPGLAGYYSGHPDYAGEVDHTALIRRLSTYDGWALSTSSGALRDLLPLCPPTVRVAAWHRGERPTRSRGPLSAWEPVLYAGGRLYVAPAAATRERDSCAAVEDDTSHSAERRVLEACATDVDLVAATRSVATRDTSAGGGRRIDSLVYRPGVRLTDPGRVVGAKPPPFARWIFDLLGAAPGDELTDLFPGSGGITRAWKLYTGQDGV